MYANWSLKGMKIVKKYFEGFIKEAKDKRESAHSASFKKLTKVFLQKNLKKGKETYNPIKSFVKNRIAYKVVLVACVDFRHCQIPSNLSRSLTAPRISFSGPTRNSREKSS